MSLLKDHPVTDDATFAEFVASRSARLLHLAYLLTRDWALAEDLLQTSLAKSWSAWRRVEGDPEPYVRRVLVNTYSRWWRQRWLHERPSESLPESAAEQAGTLEDRDLMMRALGRLPRQQRAVLVLRYYEDLSEAEIADTLGISPGTVKSHAHKAMASLRVDPDIAAAAFGADVEPPAGGSRVVAVRQRVEQRRRRRIAVAGACAVVMALLLAYALSTTSRHAPTPAQTPSPSPTSQAFGDYGDGLHFSSTALLSSESRQASLVWKIPPGDVHMHVRFSVPAHSGVVVVMTFNGAATPLTLNGSGDTEAGMVLPAAYRATYGIPADGAISVVLRLTGETDDEPLDSRPRRPAVPPGTQVALAFTEPVAWASYPFPARPAVLRGLPAIAERFTGVVIESIPGDPGAPVSVTAEWPGVLDDSVGVCWSMQTPGTLHVTANGKPALTLTRWDYDSEKTVSYVTFAMPPSTGNRLTVVVTPEVVSGAWRVWVPFAVTC
ncbi:SigE family RNA polymerase sigma factor [Hamadaea tsunoensis]|uniref:SigE family RNA polymerase sigma factor n=1 Tax=Hamadaea tsunoensis TaxID=53368 RepID=UPI000416818F|nr:SigE family RNA polymerase sigma factor [Hamadaea tsunoensis]